MAVLSKSKVNIDRFQNMQLKLIHDNLKITKLYFKGEPL